MIIPNPYEDPMPEFAPPPSTEPCDRCGGSGRFNYNRGQTIVYCSKCHGWGVVAKKKLSLAAAIEAEVAT